jgi:alkaline phosphatase
MNGKRIGKMMTVGCASALALAAATAEAAGPKYMFFFLGDGMSASQIQVTEAYLAQVNGGNSTNPANLAMNRLTMSGASACGMQTTYDDGALCTDSASAGTAFACGTKTKSNIIGMNTAKTESYYSVANGAAMYGKKVGIISSVSLDHATPAAYYANVPTRNYMNKIGTQLANSGFNFFGGGGLASPTTAKTTGDTSSNVWNMLAANGYTLRTNRTDIMGLTNAPMDKVVCINPWLQDSAAMPYEIDTPASNVKLAEMTQVAIDCMKDDPDGFFLMVEGGKIDWACHANDAMATIGDMIAFDNAVAVAAAFYAQYPNDTLIIVTGDHETGGMTVGNARLAYGVNYSVLTNQTCSYQYFGDNQWKAYKAANSTNGQTAVTMNIGDEADGEAQALLASCFGLVWNNLNAFEKERLENAYDKALGLGSPNTAQEDTQLYGGYEPMIMTLTHLVNEQAGIGWTTYAHTGVPVPVFAVGSGAWRFEGFYDNTDIAKKIVTILGYTGTLPVTK